jgi:hypothetical protein
VGGRHDISLEFYPERSDVLITVGAFKVAIAINLEFSGYSSNLYVKIRWSIKKIQGSSTHYYRNLEQP